MAFRSWPGVLIVLAMAALPARAADVTLGWKLAKGDEFDLQTVTTSEQTFTVQVEKPEYKRRNQVAQLVAASSLGPVCGLPWTALFDSELHHVKHKTELTTVYHYKVLDRTDAKIVLEQRLLNTRFQLPTKQEDPSGKPTATALEEFCRRMDDSVFTITLKPDLEITEFKGYDEFLTKVTGEKPDPKAAADAGSPLTKHVKALLSEETLRQAAREALGHWPKGPVSEGATWKFPEQGETKESLGALGTCRRTTTYKLEGPDNYDNKPVLRISYTSAITIEADKAAGGALPFQVLKADLKAENAKGTIYFDEKTGRVIATTSSLTLTGPLTITLTGDPQPVRTWIRQDYSVKTNLLTEQK